MLRLISTIYRERKLDVTQLDPGRVRIESRSLRCDPSYCATEAIDELRRLSGVQAVNIDGPDAIVVEIDAGVDARVH